MDLARLHGLHNQSCHIRSILGFLWILSSLLSLIKFPGLAHNPFNSFSPPYTDQKLIAILSDRGKKVLIIIECSSLGFAVRIRFPL